MLLISLLRSQFYRWYNVFVKQKQKHSLGHSLNYLKKVLIVTVLNWT
nr:hypothetical protein DGKKSRWO_DGKKSRWO_CDS_0060 [uncultured phage]CAI9752220.1 hypothetical protein CVNMHQAP_CVNMHQAP_CDS_0060 [uncultured phage]